MNKLWPFFKDKFLSKQFIVFVIIGFMNTAINFVVLWLSEKGFSSLYEVITNNPLDNQSILGSIFRIISVSLAFIIATIFSYFANSRFAFNNKDYSFKKLMETLGVLLIRLLIVIVLTEIVVWLFTFTDINNYLSSETSDSLANLVASVLMIPAAYLVLEKLLKVKEREDETNID